ncbi:MAG: class II glutamine amidotransferase [Thermoplasmatota archaeon]
MCRMFAYAGPGCDLRPFLLEGPRSLRALACNHAEGWGISVWSGPGAPAWTVKSPASAEKDGEFERASSVQAPRLLAHIRNASRGSPSLPNTHPFTFGPWSFVHNGTLAGFDIDREIHGLSPLVRSLRLGETDSEGAFLLFLDEVLRSPRGIDSALEDASRIVGRLARRFVDSGSGDAKNGVNFLVGNGEGFLVTRFGRELSWRSMPGGCAVASEPMGPPADWHEVADGTLLTVTPRGVVTTSF